MSITVKIQNGRAVLPSDLNIPDGTEVEIIIPVGGRRNDAHTVPVRLPAFNGGGLQAGVNLDDPSVIQQLLEGSVKFSQLP